MGLHVVNAPRALLVDMDGVLFDTERQSINLIVEIVARQGLTIPRAFIIENMGIGPQDLLERYQKYLGEGFDAALYWETYWKERNAYYSQHAMPLTQGAALLLARAQEKGIPCVLASSSPRREASASLRQAGVEKYFLGVIGGDMFRHSKPQPDIYIAAAKLAGVPTQDCLVLEDSPNGLKAGRAAGARTAMIPDVIPYTAGLAPYCNFLCDAMPDALALLGV